MDLIVRLARSGLIHGDFNEFNILIREANPDKGEVNPVPILIDFPQMVSTEHENAEYYFNRDVECIRTYFRKRYRYESSVWPRFLSTVNENDGKKDFELDVMVAASGFGKKEGEALERYMKMIEEAEGNEEDDGDDQEGSGQEEESQESQDEQVDGGGKEALSAEDEGEEADEAENQAEAEGLDRKMRKGLRVENDAESHDASEDPESGSESAESDEEQSASDEEDAASTTRQQQQRRKALERVTRDSTASRKPRDVQAIVSSNMSRQERSKHHGKKSRTDAGRSKGSKKKADPRFKMQDSF